MSTLQRGLLYTGLFNADLESINDYTGISYQSQFKNIAGQTIDIAEFKDKPIFINVWATWCPPCMAEMPEIASLYEEVGSKIVFVMISVNKDQSKAKKWARENDYDVPIYFPEQLSSELTYQTIPSTWVIDRKGNIVYQQTGMAQYNTSDFKEFLLSL